MKIVIIGAGIIGVTTAYELLLMGHEVVLLERREGAGLETSFANGGQLGASQVAPWAGPEVPGLVLRWLGDAGAPFRLSLKPDPDQWLFLLRFLARCRNSARIERLLPNLKLALLSRARMDEIAALEGFDFEESRKGILQVHHDQRSLKQASAHADVMRRGGLEQTLLDADECVRLEPALAPVHAKGGIAGGLYCAGDASGDAFSFTKQLLNRAVTKGLRFLPDHEVEDFEMGGGAIVRVRTAQEIFPADAVVLAAGTGSVRLARWLGIRLPLYPVKGYSVTLPVEGKEAPFVSLSDEARKLVVSRFGNRLRVAGTAEVAGYDTGINMARARAVLKSLTGLLPQLEGLEEKAEFWTGLRPMTPDGSPLIGKSERISNLYLNTGHGSLGWTLAAGSAAALAASLSGEIVADISPFSIRRFWLY